MMFHRVGTPEFYAHVDKLRESARRNRQTFNRRDAVKTTADHARVTYEVNGIPNAQAVMRSMIAPVAYYILR